MTTVRKNHNASPVGTIISNVMRDTTTESNRQAELIVALFEDAINYSGSVIEQLFSKSGVELTAATDEILCNVSPEYDQLSREHFALNETIRGIKKADRKPADIHAIELMIKKQRAARIMIQRSLHGVYFLRAHDAIKCAVATAGSTKVLRYSIFDESLEGNIAKTSSASALAQDGNRMLRAALGKASSTKSGTANPNSDAAKAESIKNSAKAIATVMGSMRQSGQQVFTADMEDATEKLTLSALHELMISAFGDETGLIDLETAIEFIKSANTQTENDKNKIVKAKAA